MSTAPTPPDAARVRVLVVEDSPVSQELLTTILNGDPFTGVCIVKVVEKMDAGPILGIARVPVPPEVTTPEMEEQLSQAGAELLVDVITQIGERRQIEIPQDIEIMLGEKASTVARLIKGGKANGPIVDAFRLVTYCARFLRSRSYQAMHIIPCRAIPS